MSHSLIPNLIPFSLSTIQSNPIHFIYIVHFKDTQLPKWCTTEVTHTHTHTKKVHNIQEQKDIQIKIHKKI